MSLEVVDWLGNPMNPGDKVVYYYGYRSGGADWKIDQVVGATPKMIRLVKSGVVSREHCIVINDLNLENKIGNK